MDSRDSMGLHPPSPSGLGFGAMFHHTILGGRGSTGLLHTPSAMRPSSYSPDFTHPRSSNINANANTNVITNANANANANANMNMDGGAGTGSGGSVKRKRGRPRKYGPDGSMALALTPLSSASGPPLSSPTAKRGRGRPPGSGKKQQLAALGSAGVGFTPHVIAVAAGEDVATKIMSFSQQGPRAVCILSANGAISNVTLRQPATSGGTVTYEGRFEILSLSGSFLLTEAGGTRSRSGGLSVSLAGSDGRVVGGGVAGMLVAATPVQVVVGSFLANSKKNQARPTTAELPPSGMGSSVPGTASVPIFSGMANKASTSRVGSYESQMLTQGSGVITTNNVQQPQGTTMLASLHSMG